MTKRAVSTLSRYLFLLKNVFVESSSSLTVAGFIIVMFPFFYIFFSDVVFFFVCGYLLFAKNRGQNVAKLSITLSGVYFITFFNIYGELQTMTFHAYIYLVEKPTFANSTTFEQNCVLDFSPHFEIFKSEKLTFNGRILHGQNWLILNELFNFLVFFLYVPLRTVTSKDLKYLKSFS